MSANRANASAIQRRSVNSGGQSQKPNPQYSNTSQKQNMTSSHQSKQSHSSSQKQLSNIQQATPKLSVSDAIALVTLRLGRVEMFINAMPSLEQINSSCLEEHTANENENENTRIVDSSVFNNIVSRLDKIEKSPHSLPNSSTTR